MIRLIAIDKETGDRRDVHDWMYFFEENGITDINDDSAYSSYKYEIYINDIQVYPTTVYPTTNRLTNTNHDPQGQDPNVV